MASRLESIYRRLPAPLQEVALSAVGLKLRLERFGDDYERWVAEFDRTEGYSSGELREYQDEALRSLIRHCYERVPYYRAVMQERKLRPGDIRSQTDLVKLPILTKETIRARTDELIADGLRRSDLKASPTSGTTGSPLTVYWDRTADVLWNVLIWRHRQWAGVSFGEPYATLLGREVVPPAQARPPYWRRNSAWNQTFFSTFHLGPETIDDFVEGLRLAAPRFLEAYPSTGYILALGLERAGQRIPMKAVFTSSEPLLDLQRDLIEDRFACDVFDYYGMSEAVMFAGECREHAGLHHHAEISVVEVLGPDDAPVPDGQFGRLVGTTLHNRAMPLLRYEIGDWTCRSPTPCACGRAHPLFSRVTTKAEDLIVTPDGRMISPSILTHPLKPLKGLVKSQIIQESVDRIRVLLVCAGKPENSMIEALREGFAQRLGDGVRIDLEFPDDIPPGPTGKFRWVISRVEVDKRLSGGNLYTDVGHA